MLRLSRRVLLVSAALPVVALAAGLVQHDSSQRRLEVRSSFFESGKNEGRKHSDAIQLKDSALLAQRKDDRQLSPPPPLLLGWPGWLGWLAGLTVADMWQDVKFQIPRMIKGMLFFVFGALLYIGIQAAAWLWDKQHLDEDFEELMQIEEEKGGFDVEKWKMEAEKGELDFYTCIALSGGRHKTWKSVVKFVPRLSMIIFMQLILPVLLLVCQAESETLLMYPAATGHAYRAIGVMLFAYSSHNLVTSMCDGCREDLLRYLHNVTGSGWYEWPLLLGETMNTFIGVSLLIIMFLIFCESTKPTDLLMNCIAVNFVADIDNEVVTEDDTAEALNNLSVALEEWKGNHAPDETGLADKLQQSVFHLNEVVRAIVPLAATLLTLIFAVGHDKSLCSRMRNVDPFPFCLGFSG